ncbi:MAG: xanthine dehydrogenase [Alphaproteobacteria bacterium]|nr:xanthine dehydrogenase [Alphaproteobacteria bacterium]
MKVELLDKLRGSIAAQQACALVTDTDNGQQCLVDSDGVDGDLNLAKEYLQQATQMIADDVSGQIEQTDLFVRVYGPALRLVIVGAVHISQALAPMAQLAGFNVTVLDPRDAFVRAGRLSDVSALTDWPDEGMAKVKPDSRTAVVTLTHDPKLDDPALAAALRSDAFYIGSLGSKRTHAKRLVRLKEEGFSDLDLDRIRGPVGLDIKAKTPAEIAVSILSEIVATRRRAAA